MKHLVNKKNQNQACEILNIQVLNLYSFTCINIKSLTSGSLFLIVTSRPTWYLFRSSIKALVSSNFQSPPPILRRLSSSSSLAQLLGSLLFFKVDKAAGGLWDRSEGSDGRVTDPDRWNAALLLVLLIIIVVVVPQINDISNTRTQNRKHPNGNQKLLLVNKNHSLSLFPPVCVEWAHVGSYDYFHYWLGLRLGHLYNQVNSNIAVVSARRHRCTLNTVFFLSVNSL